MRVRVDEVQLTYVKPRVDRIVWQYLVLTTDEFMHTEVFIVDVEKATKERIEELIKRRYASRYRISEKDVEVVWVAELPRPPSP